MAVLCDEAQAAIAVPEAAKALRALLLGLPSNNGCWPSGRHSKDGSLTATRDSPAMAVLRQGVTSYVSYLGNNASSTNKSSSTYGFINKAARSTEGKAALSIRLPRRQIKPVEDEKLPAPATALTGVMNCFGRDARTKTMLRRPTTNEARLFGVLVQTQRLGLSTAPGIF
ncbi:hypothetical protein HRG_000607 [Hirsutella rhossiliensis]|uniref:Uncharacterized protein n=1 Tax=Hirsutella rhossiliensis TaxID=111463 RepID=A0A9P8N6Q9_9HYPO|nr:uncharacterized protein HRG_00607 [Hirsutella rhossiliensis]KAH0967965.1 hypothetical protein HRG_00607 [Hirsutella rhossiliensis]